MRILRDWFTTPTNEHYELGRALWALGCIAVLGMSGWHLWKNGQFDVGELGLAYAGLLAAGGFGVATKDRAARHQQDPRP